MNDLRLTQEQLDAVEELFKELGDVVKVFGDGRPRQGNRSDSSALIVFAVAMVLGANAQIAVSTGVNPMACAALTQIGAAEGTARAIAANAAQAADIAQAEQLKRDGKLV